MLVQAQGLYITHLIFPLLLSLVISYLLGSISFSIIITKYYKKEDIRAFGSGNAGATNVLRTVGKKAALFTFAFDFLKCVIAVVCTRLFISYVCTLVGAPQEIAQIAASGAGLACMLGHIFPVYFGFKGGKGVVTTAALMALVDFRVFLVLFVVFLIVFAAKKIVSLASIIGCALYPVITFAVVYLFDYELSPLKSHGMAPLSYLIAAVAISAIVGAVVVIKHKDNIIRLRNGTEKAISFKKA